MIFLYILACGKPASVFLEETEQYSDEESSEESSEESIDEVVFELTVDTKPHHWINTPVTITSSIQPSANPFADDQEEWQYQWLCSNDVTGTEATLRFTPSEAGSVECSLLANSRSGSIVEPVTISTDIHEAPEFANWTILVYLAGDNNLEESAIIDLNEMEQVGSTSTVNIVVELDRSDRFYTGHDNWMGAKRFYVLKETTSEGVDPDYSDIISIEMDTLGNTDSGNPDTLSDFINWGLETFPSDKVAVVLWNHGWSWSFNSTSSTHKGIMSDDATGNDISVAQGEFESILQRAVEQRGRKIDILGLDACTMQSWEVALVSEPYAELLVASQDYVNWDGWAYDQFLGELADTPDMASIELAESINRTFWRSGDSTISTIELNHLSAFNEDLNILSEELLGQQTPTIIPIAAQTYSPDGASGQDHDLFGLLEILRTDGPTSTVQTKAEQLLQMQTTLVPHNFIGDWIEGAHGLSIHAPPSFDWDLEQDYQTARWAEYTLWDDLLVHELQRQNATTTAE